nr:hypothetical protein [Tanacetum cinerariifolium]
VDSSFGLKAEGRRAVEEYLFIDFFIIGFGSEVQSRQKNLSQVLCASAPKGYKLQEEEVWPQQPPKAKEATLLQLEAELVLVLTWECMLLNVMDIIMKSQWLQQYNVIGFIENESSRFLNVVEEAHLR